MTRSGFADLPLHGGRVPAWLAERAAALRAFGAAFAAQRSVLVPGSGQCDGDGLAFFGNHYVCARGLRAGQGWLGGITGTRLMCGILFRRLARDR